MLRYYLHESDVILGWREVHRARRECHKHSVDVLETIVPFGNELD